MNPRPTCPRCRLPQVTCLCRWVRPLLNQRPVLVLQHPDEAHHAKGSARLLALSLANLRCVVLRPHPPPDWGLLLGAPGRSLLLFPSDEATAGSPDGAPPPAGPLVVLDGTWRQARQMLRDHAELQALPRMALPAPPPPRYAIRRAQRPLHQRSTLEATCLALGGLEGRPDHYAPLLDAFSGWVADVAARASARSG